MIPCARAIHRNSVSRWRPRIAYNVQPLRLLPPGSPGRSRAPGPALHRGVPEGAAASQVVGLELEQAMVSPEVNKEPWSSGWKERLPLNPERVWQVYYDPCGEVFWYMDDKDSQMSGGNLFPCSVVRIWVEPSEFPATPYTQKTKCTNTST